MADARATFAVELETQGLVKPGDEAANVLERLKNKIRQDVDALASMNAAMRNLKGGSSVNVAAFRQLRDQIAAQRQVLASAQADYVNLGGRLSELTKKAFTGTDGIKTLSDAAGVADGPLGRMLGRFAGLTSKLGRGGFAGAALLGVAAIVALTAALTVATLAAASALVKYGVASANAARSEFLHLKGLTTIRNWYGLAAGKAEDLQASINKVSASSALGRDQVARYAEQLYKMGLRGKNLDDALEGTAIKASVQGEQWASLFMNMAAGANMTGGSVRKLADDVRARLGGIAKAQALDLNVQLSKLRESWAQLFSGLNIEPLLKGLHEVTQLFSQNTATGKALKVLIETLFTPLIGQLGGLGHIAKRAFQYFVLGLQEVVIASMQVLLWLRRTFGIRPLDLFRQAIRKMAADVKFLGSVLMIPVREIQWIAEKAEGLLATLGKLKDALGFGDGAKSAGADVAKSFAQGITEAPGMIANAAAGLGKDAIAALRKALDMHSPSKPMLALGSLTSRSFAMGVTQGTPQVSRSVTEMVQVPSKLGAPGAAAGMKLSGGGVTIGELHYHSGPGETSQKISQNVQHLRDELTKVLEGLGHEVGAF